MRGAGGGRGGGGGEEEEEEEEGYKRRRRVVSVSGRYACMMHACMYMCICTDTYTGTYVLVPTYHICVI